MRPNMPDTPNPVSNLHAGVRGWHAWQYFGPLWYGNFPVLRRHSLIKVKMRVKSV